MLGFLIPRTQVQNWLIWAYYLSPFSWATDALAVNEFTAGIYSDPDPANPSQSIGVTYLQSFALQSDKIWQWAAIAYLWGFYLVMAAIAVWFLATTKPTPTMGAKRGLTHKKKAVDSTSVVLDVNAPKRLAGGKSSAARASFQLAALPFTPATLAWKDLNYTVYVGKEKTPKVLLNRISGYAEPGKLTALMGSSGAGENDND
jgi:hypothetical protein